MIYVVHTVITAQLCQRSSFVFSIYYMRFLMLFKLKHIKLEHNQLIFDNWRDRRASKHMLFPGQKSRHKKKTLTYYCLKKKTL